MPLFTSATKRTVYALGEHFERMILAFLKEDGHTQADRVLSEMEALDIEQLEAACRVILAAIEARR